jgi:hypothetical protein
MQRRLAAYYYATQYDWREFYSIADGKLFRVVVAGNPFPTWQMDDVDAPAPAADAGQQAAACRSHSPMTGRSTSHGPTTGLVLIFIRPGISGLRVCATGQTRVVPPNPGRVYLFGIYCRNELALSQTTGWTDASGPDDPRMGDLFKDMFGVLFSDSPALYQRNGPQRLQLERSAPQLTSANQTAWPSGTNSPIPCCRASMPRTPMASRFAR